KTRLFCGKFDLEKAAKCDVIFLAVPHTVSMSITPKLLAKGVKVIDLSGDYRLGRSDVYKKWYKVAHKDTANLRKSVYGLPELYREDIKKANLIANPGCYPTAAVLALAPMVSVYGKNIQSLIIDAKSGASGAGRKATVNLSFCEVDENFKAYKVLNHQHVPEIELYLSKVTAGLPNIHFVPHLLPVKHGILETIYIQLDKKVTAKHLETLYKRFYKIEPFVRVKSSGLQPELKDVVGTNYCDIGFAVDAKGTMAVITSAIDNLIKGAAGQAVQNMNIMFDFEENEGIL
ncbi:MAG: N-acetyl-gamma-glutamyl-phosphate reductase, partial [Candidatus Omnitrophica bacterium]|nr:N-acetyl-gamma-glutamyl-phosphate reductase [Candidatus Omnitrophota bacterium]